MDDVEQRCWTYLVNNMDASADEVALNCDVSVSYAAALIARIGTPRELLTDADFTPAPYAERIRLLSKGIELTGGDRNAVYGDPWDNLTACAALWEAYLTAKYSEVHLVAEDVAHMMQLVKMTRTFHGGYHADNYVDNATYGAIAGECRKIEESFG